MANESSGPKPFTQEEQKAFRAELHAGLIEEEIVLWENARCQADYEAVWKMRDARQQSEEEERKKQEWNRSQAKLLLDHLGHAYTAYTNYLGQAPHMQQNALEQDAENQNVYDQLRTNLERANNAPRCAHVKASGGRCRARKCAAVPERQQRYYGQAGRGSA